MQRDGGPGGAGGAGNPTGGSFTGPAETLEITQNLAYAYSGAIALNNETKTTLEFRTGNFTFFSNTQLTGETESLGSNEHLALIISLNGVRVLLQKTKANANTGGVNLDYDSFAIIIPPYTEVKVEVDTNNAASLSWFTTMTGRIYRG